MRRGRTTGERQPGEREADVSGRGQAEGGEDSNGAESWNQEAHGLAGVGSDPRASPLTPAALSPPCPRPVPALSIRVPQALPCSLAGRQSSVTTFHHLALHPADRRGASPRLPLRVVVSGLALASTNAQSCGRGFHPLWPRGKNLRAVRTGELQALSGSENGRFGLWRRHGLAYSLASLVCRLGMCGADHIGSGGRCWTRSWGWSGG